jgi:DNA-binding PadR family transcriptional regulator
MTQAEATPTDEPTEDELTNLTGFQRDVILCLAQDGPQKGTSVLQWLAEHGYDDPNHGRLYPNLDELQQRGFVAKSSRDKRTNEYALTSLGRGAVLAQQGAWDAAWTRTVKRGD